MGGQSARCPDRRRRVESATMKTPTRLAPGTGLSSWDTPAHPAYNFWGTGNVEEVLPNITRPLPADISGAYMHIYAATLVDQLKARDLVEVAPMPAANIFGFIGGRWAVNVAWLGAYVASYQADQASDMLGQFVRGGGTESGVAANMRRARQARQTVERLWRKALAASVVEAETARKLRLAALRARLAGQTDAQLLTRIDRGIAVAGRMFVNHALVSIGGAERLGELSALLDRAVPGHPPEWPVSLTSALRNLESARPVQGIWELAQAARARRGVARDLRSEDATVIKARLAAPPDDEWRAFGAAFGEFMDRYGFRGQRETDPSVADWAEEPAFVVSSLKANLAMSTSRDPLRQEERAALAREKLEARIVRKLTAGDAEAFRSILAECQAYVRGREQTKSNWAQVCRSFRPPLLGLGLRLAERGLIAQRDDVFFLRLNELREAASGGLGRRAARGRVTARKEEYEALHHFELPVTFTMPVELIPVAAPETPSGKVALLSGAGVSAGVASGRARIILDAEADDSVEILPGEVLVAPYTDAPWTPLFWPAAAVVVERGGMLSHASTVAREFGIPAVVAVQHATTLISTGDLVTVDGTTGTVTVERA